MIFSRLTECFEKLERTSSRNVMISILAELFKESTISDIDKICYFSVDRIAAGYKDVQLGIGDEMAKSAIALAASADIQKVEEEFKEIGDLGEVAYRLIGAREKRFEEFFKFGEALSVEDVYRGLKKIVTVRGSGSQEVKKKTLAAMLSAATPTERRYIARLTTVEMRLGVGDMTLLDALAITFLEPIAQMEKVERKLTVQFSVKDVEIDEVQRGFIMDDFESFAEDTKKLWNLAHFSFT